MFRNPSESPLLKNSVLPSLVTMKQSRLNRHDVIVVKLWSGLSEFGQGFWDGSKNSKKLGKNATFEKKKS